MIDLDLRDGKNALKKEEEAARFLNVKIATLRKWRKEGKPPRFIRISRRCVRYDPIDLEKFLSENRV